MTNVIIRSNGRPGPREGDPLGTKRPVANYLVLSPEGEQLDWWERFAGTPEDRAMRNVMIAKYGVDVVIDITDMPEPDEDLSFELKGDR